MAHGLRRRLEERTALLEQSVSTQVGTNCFLRVALHACMPVHKACIINTVLTSLRLRVFQRSPTGSGDGVVSHRSFSFIHATGPYSGRSFICTTLVILRRWMSALLADGWLFLRLHLCPPPLSDLPWSHHLSVVLRFNKFLPLCHFGSHRHSFVRVFVRWLFYDGGSVYRYLYF